MAVIQEKIRALWTREAAAGGAITPGHFLQYSAAETVVVHGTAAGAVNAKLVALEDQTSGKGIDDAYASGDRVILQPMLPGEEVQAIASAAIAVNAQVESTGDGRVRTLTGSAPVGIALEAAASAGDRISIMIV